MSDDQLQIHIVRSETIKIVNYSSRTILSGQAESIAGRSGITRYNGRASTEFVFGFDLETRERIPGDRYNISLSFEHERKYIFVDNLRSIRNNEGILLLVDDLGQHEEKDFGVVDAVGLASTTEGDNRVFILESDHFISPNGPRTIGHEEGHRHGLSHIHDKPNIMSYNHRDSFAVLPEQKQTIGESLFNRLISYVVNRTGYDLQNFVVRYNYGKSAETDIEEALETIDEHNGEYTRPEGNEK